MKNNVWGPVFWKLIHVLCNNISNENFIRYKNKLIITFYNIFNILPCKFCYHHTILYIKKYKLQNISNKRELITYFNEFHNQINRKLNKPHFTYTDTYTIPNIDLEHVILQFINIIHPYNSISLKHVSTKHHVDKIVKDIRLLLGN